MAEKLVQYLFRCTPTAVGWTCEGEHRQATSMLAPFIALQAKVVPGSKDFFAARSCSQAA